MLELIAIPLIFALLAIIIKEDKIKYLVYLAAIGILALGIRAMFLPDSTSDIILFDGLSRLFVFVLSIVSSMTLLYSTAYIKSSQNRFYFLVLFFIAAMFGFVIANHVLMFFICWEIISICSFLLISFDYKNEHAVKAGNKCFMLTQIGGLLVLTALIFLSKNLSFSISNILANYSLLSPTILLVSSVLLVFGALSKSSIFPFNWLSDAMEAPIPVSALLHSATMVNAGVFIMIRFLPIIKEFQELSYMIMAFAFISMFYATFSALIEDNIKRILAFSTITNLSFIFATLAIFSSAATSAATYHLLNHAFFKSALFLSIGIVIHHVGKMDLKHMEGLANYMGRLKFVFVFLVMAAVGMPFTNLSKWAIYSTWFNALPIGLILLACGTVLAIVYYSKIVGVLFGKEVRTLHPPVQFWAPVAVLAFITLLFGVSITGYDIFVMPITGTTINLPVDFSLITLLFVFAFGIALSPAKVVLDKTGPFTGGEEVLPDFYVRDFFGNYLDKFRKIASALTIDHLYKKIAGVNVAFLGLDKFEDFIDRDFVFLTLIMILISFMILLG
jgi:NADH:ubiquinone oxidoreductase subunit 5 (subunit L)/multisubunit Na+/H+ antiporter MnhA subunit